MRRVAILLFAGVGVVAAVLAPPTSTASEPAVRREPPLERAIVQRINDVRAEHGLEPLSLSPALGSAAAVHTRALAVRGLFQHESVDGTPFQERVGRYYGPSGFRTWTVAENLVFGSAPFSAEQALRAWLRSPPHRQNLLGSTWREVGVGAVVVRRASGVFGGGTVVIVTADFGARSR
jgi:uncharacterized protein YkwD